MSNPEPTLVDRRVQVLEAALTTFARYGYKKTSMDDVARAADISRPGLYFLFTSKPNLFLAAVTHALTEDVEAAQRSLADVERPLRDRLIEAFDLWTGRYVGPMAKEVAVLIETSPDLLGSVATDFPQRFRAIVAEAIAVELPSGRAGLANDMARTLASTAAGIKYDVAVRAEFVERMTIAVDLFLPALQGAQNNGRPRATKTGPSSASVRLRRNPTER